MVWQNTDRKSELKENQLRETSSPRAREAHVDKKKYPVYLVYPVLIFSAPLR
jgi:hypothetical protein